jgi:hypothetical protein
MSTMTLPRLGEMTRAQLRDQQSIDFMKYLATLAETRGASQRAVELFLDRFPESASASAMRKALESSDLATKAAIAPGTSTDSAWAKPLIGVQQLAAGFLAVAHSASLLGRIPGLQEIPFNTKVPFETTPANYQWVAEGALKPSSKLAFSDGITLSPTKCLGIIVLTAEFMKLSSPGTARALRQTMIGGLTAFVDRQFLDPAVAAVAGTHPASITNGTTPVTGTADFVASVKALITAFFAARPGAEAPVLIANGGHAAAIRGQVPGFGLEVIASEAALTNVVMLDPAGVFYADGGLEIDYSTHAALEMDSAPVGTAAAVVSSLWQLNLVGWRVERFINYAAAPTAVKYLTTV